MVYRSVWFELDGEAGVATAWVEKMGVGTAWVVVVAVVITACIGGKAMVDTGWEEMTGAGVLVGTAAEVQEGAAAVLMEVGLDDPEDE